MEKEKKLNLTKKSIETTSEENSTPRNQALLTLKESSENIKKLRLKNIELTEQILAIHKKTSNVKNSLMFEITNELLDGKKKFSNADQRQVEFERIIASDQDYSNDITFIKSMEDVIEKNRVEIEYLDRVFRYTELVLK